MMDMVDGSWLMRIHWVALVLVSALLLVRPASASEESNSLKPVIVRANFGKWTDYPLAKTKFAAYNSGWVPGHLTTYKRDIRLFDEVRPDALRIDGVLGSPKHILFSTPPIISGMLEGLK